MNKPFIRRGGLDLQPPPWACDEARGHGFAFEGGAAELQALCDRCLNVPSGGKYRYVPDGPYVHLSVQRIKGLHSAHAPEAARVKFTYNEAAWWVPVKDATGQDPALRVLLPYVFLDSGVPMAVGREIYGFAKELAAVTYTAAGGAPSAVALPACNLYEGEATPQLLLSIERPNTPLPAAGRDLLSADNRADTKKLLQLEAAPLPFGSLVQRLLQGQLRFVFLRQFIAPAVADCDVQQLVALDVPLTRPSLTPIVGGGYLLKVNEYLSHPLVGDLGLRLDAAGQLAPTLAYELDTTFTLPAGTVL